MLFESGTDVLISEENDHNDKLQHSNTNEIKDDFIIDFQKQSSNKVPVKKSYTCDGITMRLRKPLFTSVLNSL